jgi:hypothetical protein
MGQQFYAILSALVLAAHVTWILWVILGALLTRGRPRLAWFHIASLIYSVVIDAGPWLCPLTGLEQSLQAKAGMTPYRQGCVIHYLEALVYPDVPEAVVTWGAVAAFVANAGVYLARFRKRASSHVA